MFMEFMINVNVEKCLGCKKNWRKTTTKKRLRGGKKSYNLGFWLAMTSQGWKFWTKIKKRKKKYVEGRKKSVIFFADIHWKLLGLKTAL